MGFGDWEEITLMHYKGKAAYVTGESKFNS